MGARLLVFVGMVFGGFVFFGNALLIIENIGRGQSFVGAAVAALVGGLIGAGSLRRRSEGSGEGWPEMT